MPTILGWKVLLFVDVFLYNNGDSPSLFSNPNEEYSVKYNDYNERKIRQKSAKPQTMKDQRGFCGT